MSDSVLLNIYSCVEEHYAVELTCVTKVNINWAFDFLQEFESFNVDFFVASIFNAVDLVCQPVNCLCEEDIVMFFVCNSSLSCLESLMVIQFFDGYDWSADDIFDLIDNSTCRLVKSFDLYDSVCCLSNLESFDDVLV